MTWSTATERDNDYFEVERSVDGRVFEPVGRVAGDADSRSTKSYTLTDYRPYTGTSYYRLAQVDLDGTTTYSDAVSVSRGRDGDRLALRPNPARSGSSVLVTGLGDADEELRVLDATGRVVFTAFAKPVGGQLPIDLPAELSPGLYYVQVLRSDALRSEVLQLR